MTGAAPTTAGPDPAALERAALPAFLRPLAWCVHQLHRAIQALAMLALLAAAGVLTWSVFSRYFFKMATDWQDEAAVFLLVGATFACAGQVQLLRGHVGIEAVAGLLGPRVDRWRGVLIDLLSLAFCAFFAWKSWTLWHEAWVDGQTTSSSWAPPLAIPYGFMAFGMSLLSLQIFLQLVVRISRLKGAKA
ncbi:TRAP transporter small permease [Pelomonas sp. SE-A7]|uniref:TRAP transporter small permease n=1 Tax=Pelomonas sp. SE-A7 TaxID=3054953 RepID=UPI00259C8EA1|nr:TRAP transporter small permease [Pelomonas sp. SE-A7]MDM4766581.1 TRAP transporter small permease [Pelomonas sp. SE-A7]